MATTASLQDTTYSITIKSTFKITEFQNLITAEPGTKECYSESFGPGWQLQLEPKVTDSLVYLAVYLSFVQPSTPVLLSIKLALSTLSGRSLVADEFMHTFRYGDPEEGWGLPMFISKSSIWDNNPEVRNDNGILASVEVKFAAPCCFSLSTPNHLRPSAALSLGRVLQGEEEIDTKFVLYNRRPSSKGDASALKAVFANSAILQDACSYFVPLLHKGEEGGFSEPGFVTDLEGDLLDSMPDFEACYDYTSDSDMEDGIPDPEPSAAAAKGASGKTNESSPSNPTPKTGEQIAKSEGEDNSAQDKDDDKDKDDDAQSEKTQSQDIEKSTELPPKNLGTPKQAGTGTRSRVGYVVRVGDVAYKTWMAMIYYLYTGTIRFAPLSSEGHHTKVTMKKSHHNNIVHAPELVSCKSVWRLAEKVGLPELEELALSFLKSRLEPDTIGDEIFSSFTARYEQIKKVELQYLYNNWTEVVKSARFQEKMDEVVEGKVPHANPILKEILKSVKPTLTPNAFD